MNSSLVKVLITVLLLLGNLHPLAPLSMQGHTAHAAAKLALPLQLLGSCCGQENANGLHEAPCCASCPALPSSFLIFWQTPPFWHLYWNWPISMSFPFLSLPLRPPTI